MLSIDCLCTLTGFIHITYMACGRKWSRYSWWLYSLAY